MMTNRPERGFAIVLVLILLGVGGLMIVPAVRLTNTQLLSRAVFAQDIRHDYTAEAAIVKGLWQVKHEPGFAASLEPGVDTPTDSVTLNGVTATSSIVSQATVGELGAVALGDKHQVLVTKDVTPTTALRNKPTTFTFTISIRRMEPDDLAFEAIEKVFDAMDAGFTYVPDSSILDAAPFDDDDLSLLASPITFKEEKQVFENDDADRDSWVDQASSTTNFGSDITMFVQSRDASRNRRSFVSFDISAMTQPGVTVSKAELRLCANGAQASGDSRNYDVHRVTAPWTEATVTWDNQPAVAASATATTKAPKDANKCIKWDVKADIEAWANGTPNHGWRITDDIEDSATAFTTAFRTSDDTAFDATEHPALQNVEFLPGYFKITWEFEPRLEFPTQGDTRTLSFQATASLPGDDTRYCNIAQVKSPENDSNSGLTAAVTVGTPPYSGCPGGGATVTKTANPPVVYPGIPTVVTYQISITNNGPDDLENFDSIVDLLPPGFAYVIGSATWEWDGDASFPPGDDVNGSTAINSPDNPIDPVYNICDFEPDFKSMADGRLQLKWHRDESANGLEPGVDRCHNYPLPQGATFTQTFQALADLEESGSYYNEVTAKVKFLTNRGIGKFNELYSGPTAGTIVPDFDLQASTELTTLRSNAEITAAGIEVMSWHWKKRR